MKTLAKLILSAAILLTSVVGLAREPKLSIISNENVKSLIFELDSKAIDTNLEFVDSDKNVIYSEMISNTMYLKKFNLSKLVDGTYFLRTEDDFKFIEHVISLKGNVVKVVERKEENKPVFKIVEDKVYLNLLNLDMNSIDIKVTDSSNRVIFKESLGEVSLVEKAFNFETAQEDRYTIVVNDGTEVYYKSIVVN